MCKERAGSEREEQGAGNANNINNNRALPMASSDARTWRRCRRCRRLSAAGRLATRQGCSPAPSPCRAAWAPRRSSSAERRSWLVGCGAGLLLRVRVGLGAGLIASESPRGGNRYVVCRRHATYSSSRACGGWCAREDAPGIACPPRPSSRTRAVRSVGPFWRQAVPWCALFLNPITGHARSPPPRMPVCRSSPVPHARHRRAQRGLFVRSS